MVNLAGHEVERLGCGMHSTCYREVAGDRRVFAVQKSAAQDKEVLVCARESAPRNQHLPEVERLEFLGGQVALGGRNVFVMPFYEVPLKREHEQAWKDYELLKLCRDDYYYDGCMLKCAEDIGVSPKVVEALHVLRKEALKITRHYTFEFAPRNLTVNEQGDLVLLDVLYDMQETAKIKRALKRNRRRKT